MDIFNEEHFEPDEEPEEEEEEPKGEEEEGASEAGLDDDMEVVSLKIVGAGEAVVNGLYERMEDGDDTYDGDNVNVADDGVPCFIKRRTESGLSASRPIIKRYTLQDKHFWYIFEVRNLGGVHHEHSHQDYVSGLRRHRHAQIHTRF